MKKTTQTKLESLPPSAPAAKSAKGAKAANAKTAKPSKSAKEGGAATGKAGTEARAAAAKGAGKAHRAAKRSKGTEKNERLAGAETTASPAKAPVIDPAEAKKTKAARPAAPRANAASETPSAAGPEAIRLQPAATAASSAAPADASGLNTARDALPRPPRGRFASMTIEELQALYLSVIGRPTGSSAKPYLIWKIREAEKGRIPIGARTSRTPGQAGADMRILPLRLATPIVEAVDQAWRTLGLDSRMELFRRALGHYLAHVGANDAAAFFARA